ncbi:MAG TPA: hypothetical protein VEC93_25140, partial [Anaerolineae bacterium]|nr:hypothetical protein [Anaerolineae bacterium]
MSSPPRVLASSPHLATTLLILAYIACYFVAINLSATKIDRYLVAILPGLAIWAALGFNWLISSFAGLGRLTWLKNRVVWGVLLAGGAWMALPHHPYYYTYWNPLLGGGRTAVNILPVPFRLGLDEPVAYLNQLPDASEIKLSGSNLEMGQECQVIFVGHCVESEKFLSGDYFLLSRYVVQHEMVLSNIQTIIPDLELIQKFNKAGVDYAWLYKMPAGLQYAGYWLDLSAGSFSGYRLSATEVRAGDSVEATLFWQNSEKNGWRFDDSELFVKVLDEIGQTQQIIPARLKPEFKPYLYEPNEVLVFTAPLHFPPDTPLGIYSLEMGLRLKATGQETVNFPLTGLANTIIVKQGAPAADLPIQHHLDQPIGETGLTLLGYDDPFSKST